MREHEKSDAHGTAEQMRQLEDREGHEPPQQVETITDAGGRPRQEQNGARDEHRDGARLRGDRAEPGARELGNAHHRPAVHPQLVRAKQTQGHAEGHEIIDDAVRE